MMATLVHPLNMDPLRVSIFLGIGASFHTRHTLAFWDQPTRMSVNIEIVVKCPSDPSGCC